MNAANDKRIQAKMKTNAKKLHTPKPETFEWLMTVGRDGRKRVEKLGWKRLAKMWFANKPNSPIRKAINSEARKCGYTTSIMMFQEGMMQCFLS